MCQVTQITGLAPQAGLCMVGRHLSRLGCSGNLPTTAQPGRDGTLLPFLGIIVIENCY